MSDSNTFSQVKRDFLSAAKHYNWPIVVSSIPIVSVEDNGCIVIKSPVKSPSVSRTPRNGTGARDAISVDEMHSNFLHLSVSRPARMRQSMSSDSHSTHHSAMSPTSRVMSPLGMHLACSTEALTFKSLSLSRAHSPLTLTLTPFPSSSHIHTPLVYIDNEGESVSSEQIFSTLKRRRKRNMIVDSSASGECDEGAGTVQDDLVSVSLTSVVNTYDDHDENENENENGGMSNGGKFNVSASTCSSSSVADTITSDDTPVKKLFDSMSSGHSGERASLSPDNDVTVILDGSDQQDDEEDENDDDDDEGEMEDDDDDDDDDEVEGPQNRKAGFPALSPVPAQGLSTTLHDPQRLISPSFDMTRAPSLTPGNVVVNDNSDNDDNDDNDASSGSSPYVPRSTLRTRKSRALVVSSGSESSPIPRFQDRSLATTSPSPSSHGRRSGKKAVAFDSDLDSSHSASGAYEYDVSLFKNPQTISPGTYTSPDHAALIWDTLVTPGPDTDVISKTPAPGRSPLTPLAPTSCLRPPRTAAKTTSCAAFARKREKLALSLLAEFNDNIFESQLPVKDIPVTWNARLNKTAGQTYCVFSLGKRSARIELSTKVVDTENKLRNTLCHELCHAAAWLINKTCKPPHGKAFKYWGSKAMRAYQDIEVTTLHTYKIAYKYWYQCSNVLCLHRYGRHSKSIDVHKHRCGHCSGSLVFLPPKKKDGTPFKPSAYTQFVKKNFARIKQHHQGKDHGEIMKLLSAEWHGHKRQQRALASDGDGGGKENLANTSG